MSTGTMPVAACPRAPSRLSQLATALVGFVTACREVAAEVRALRIDTHRRYPFADL